MSSSDQTYMTPAEVKAAIEALTPKQKGELANSMDTMEDFQTAWLGWHWSCKTPEGLYGSTWTRIGCGTNDLSESMSCCKVFLNWQHGSRLKSLMVSYNKS